MDTPEYTPYIDKNNGYLIGSSDRQSFSLDYNATVSAGDEYVA
jgi:hypothetical protein